MATVQTAYMSDNVCRRRLIPLHITQFTVGPLQTNGFVVRDERSSEALIIDPGDEPDRILAVLDSAALRCSAVLITHGHFDHIGAVAQIVRTSASTVYISAGEASCLFSPDPGASGGLNIPERVEPDVLLAGDEVLELAGLTVRCIPVPGHSPAGLAFVISAPDAPDEPACFPGDAIFAGSVGRTDLEGGSWPTLAASLTRLRDAVGPDTPLHPGHGPATTFRQELITNPFLEHLRSATSDGLAER